MPLPVASAADFGVAPAAFGVFATVSLTDPFWFNPLTATFLRAVDAVSSRILGKFSIPILLELGAELFID